MRTFAPSLHGAGSSFRLSAVFLVLDMSNNIVVRPFSLSPSMTGNKTMSHFTASMNTRYEWHRYFHLPIYVELNYFNACKKHSEIQSLSVFM